MKPWVCRVGRLVGAGSIEVWSQSGGEGEKKASCLRISIRRKQRQNAVYHTVSAEDNVHQGVP